MKHVLPIEGKWWEIDDRWIAGRTPAVRQEVEARIALWERNKLACFLPHGVAWSDRERMYGDGDVVKPPSEYPAEWRNDGVAFLNDWEHDYILLVAPRKTGKTIHGAVKMLLMGLKTEKWWPIFTENGVKRPEWTGPKTIAVASFSWKNVREVWEVYREVMPRDELGPYAPRWGLLPGERGRAKNLSFESNRSQEITTLKSGLRLIFMCYTQKQAAWENFRASALHADEQIPESKLTAFMDGTRTMGDYTPVIFTLSGFVLDERPEDTGALGYVKTQFWDAEEDPRIGRYNLDIETTPNAVMSLVKKKQAYDIYVNPEVKRTKKMERRAAACYWPGWEKGGASAFGPEVWDRDVHVIPRLWLDGKTPRWATLYRTIDYCDRKTTVCLWIAVGPLGMFERYASHGQGGVTVEANPGSPKDKVVAIVYRVLYQQNMLVAEAVREIIEMSGNKREYLGQESDFETGNTYEIWKEVQSREKFEEDILDSRMGAQRQQGQTVLEIFERYGLTQIEPACGDPNSAQIPRLKDLMRIEPSETHPWNCGWDGKPVPGCPSLFFFEGVGEEVIEEIEQMPRAKPSRAKEDSIIDRSKPHDGIDALKYWASAEPRWRGTGTISDQWSSSRRSGKKRKEGEVQDLGMTEISPE